MNSDGLPAKIFFWFAGLSLVLAFSSVVLNAGILLVLALIPLMVGFIMGIYTQRFINKIKERTK